MDTLKETEWYRLYLGTDIDGYEGPFDYKTLNEVDMKLNKSSIYDKYLVLLYDENVGIKDYIAMGRIEINKKRKTR